MSKYMLLLTARGFLFWGVTQTLDAIILYTYLLVTLRTLDVGL